LSITSRELGTKAAPIDPGQPDRYQALSQGIPGAERHRNLLVAYAYLQRYGVTFVKEQFRFKSRGASQAGNLACDYPALDAGFVKFVVRSAFLADKNPFSLHVPL
jgi:hypothetical protein